VRLGGRFNETPEFLHIPLVAEDPRWSCAAIVACLWTGVANCWNGMRVARQLGLADSSPTHIGRAVRWIRENYTRPFRVDEVAQLSGMSVSAFHRNFRRVTAMSPIQFQKRIRPRAARLLLANSPDDVTGVGNRVGYDSPAQFSPEYRPQFGAPPGIDAARMRGGAGPAPVTLL
jgi:AraC-like DNA-binding protein